MVKGKDEGEGQQSSPFRQGKVLSCQSLAAQTLASEFLIAQRVYMGPNLWGQKLERDCKVAKFLGSFMNWAVAEALPPYSGLNDVLQATYEKLQAEVPKYKMITPSVLSDRLRVWSHCDSMSCP